MNIIKKIFHRTGPKVSALMPIYNSDPDRLRNTIASILNQTFSDFEFIILNDSPDNRQLDKVIASFRDKRIRYYRNKVNLGISGARNRLLDLARGEYLAIVDHDDISLPDRFAMSVAFLDEHPNVGVVGGARLVNGAEHPLSHYPNNNLDIKRYFFRYVAICHPTCMIRASVLKRHNVRYESQYSPAEDYMLFVRLIEFTEFYNLPEYLINYIALGDNTCANQAERLDNAAEEIKFQLRNKYPFEAMQMYS